MSLTFSNGRIFNGLDKQLVLVDYTLVNESLDSVSIIGSHPDHHDLVIYLPHKLHQSFISKMEQTPLRKFNCTIKSLQNVVTNVYKDNRKTNATGNMTMSKFQPELFSHLKVYQNQPEEEVYLILDDLAGYHKVSSTKREELFKVDCENLFKNKLNFKQINLIISEKFNFIDSSLFKSVSYFKHYEEGIQQFLENNFGIKISSEVNLYTETIEFNPEAELDLAVSLGKSEVMARSRGRFDFNGCSLDEKGSLILIGQNLKKLKDVDLVLPIVSKDLSASYLNKFLKTFGLSKNLPENRTFYLLFLETNKDIVFDHLIGVKNHLEETNEINKMLNYLFSQFHEKIINFIEKMKYEDGRHTPEYPLYRHPKLEMVHSVAHKQINRGFSSFE